MSIKKPEILLNYNKSWADRVNSKEPTFFDELSRDQHPEYLWIGCSDSRVPETMVVKQNPGDIFVHRNIANLVLHSDLNCQSVLQYAVEILKVKHIIVCGHYGCGGIKAALTHERLGLIDSWLNNIRELAQLNHKKLATVKSEAEKANLLAELNVEQQVHHVCDNPFVQSEWASGRELFVHGWMYNLKTGVIKDLNISADKDTALHQHD